MQEILHTDPAFKLAIKSIKKEDYQRGITTMRMFYNIDGLYSKKINRWSFVKQSMENKNYRIRFTQDINGDNLLLLTLNNGKNEDGSPNIASVMFKISGDYEHFVALSVSLKEQKILSDIKWRPITNANRRRVRKEMKAINEKYDPKRL